MPSDNNGSKQRPLSKMIYRFLGGAALGTLVLLIPVTYGTFNDFELVQTGVASVLVVSFGLLSVLWGDKFVDTVTRILNSTGL